MAQPVVHLRIPSTLYTQQYTPPAEKAKGDTVPDTAKIVRVFLYLSNCLVIIAPVTCEGEHPQRPIYRNQPFTVPGIPLVVSASKTRVSLR